MENEDFALSEKSDIWNIKSHQAKSLVIIYGSIFGGSI